MSELMDPRKITQNTIAEACMASVDLWIIGMYEEASPESLKHRTPLEWLVSARYNALVMHDNCFASGCIMDALLGLGLYIGDRGRLPKGENEKAFNEAIWLAVTHLGGKIRKPELNAYLQEFHSMTQVEIDRFITVLREAPEDGLELACKERCLEYLRAKDDLTYDELSPENIIPVSDTEKFMSSLVDWPAEEIRQRAKLSVMLKKGLYEKMEADEYDASQAVSLN